MLLPVGDGWEMKVHSGNTLVFRSRADLEAARDRMDMVLHALEGVLLGLSSRDHCSPDSARGFQISRNASLRQFFARFPLEFLVMMSDMDGCGSSDSEFERFEDRQILVKIYIVWKMPTKREFPDGAECNS